MRKCPRCGLLSPDQSVRCECGFHFEVDDRAAVLREHARWTQSARAHLAGGLLLAGMDAVMSILDYVRASEKGGSYFIWYGAVVAGGGLAIRAWMRIRAIRRAEHPLDGQDSAG